MEIIRNYDLFKQKCSDFCERFDKELLCNHQLICHPTIRNLIITPCSDEESKSNGLNICRMADVLLMSDDANDWQTFVIADARTIAEQNNFVYITDLFLESAFQAEYWMINGQNDTVVVSEEYMREKGRKYAPVTPLTNKVLHYKKNYNAFFWKAPENGQLCVVDKAYVGNKLDKYADDVLNDFPDINTSEQTSFTLFNEEIDISESCIKQNNVEAIFDIIDNICKNMYLNKEIISYTDYKFNIVDYIAGIIVTYLQNHSIGITKEKFLKDYHIAIMNDNTDEKLNRLSKRSNNAEIDAIKLSLIEILEKDTSLNFTYVQKNNEEFMQKLQDIEISDPDEVDIQYMISELLKEKPVTPVIFNLIMTMYPDETENVKKIADYWGMTPLTDDEVRDYIYTEYIINKKMLNQNGEFDIELEYARIVKDNLIAVTGKYNFADSPFLAELNAYIYDIDKQQRSYNGTVFETIEDMKRAMANELRLQELCEDLSALDMGELEDLKKHITNLTTDTNTSSKYLVKVKIAMNRCEENQLEQLCMGLPLKNLDEMNTLKEKIESKNFEESVLNEYMSKINDRIMTAQREELNNLFEKTDNKTLKEINELETVLNSGRYNQMFVKFYSKKINLLKDSIAKAELDKICVGYEKLSRDDLTSLKNKVEQLDIEDKLKNRYVKKIISQLSNFDKLEVDKIFSEIDTSTPEKLQELKQLAQSGKYSKVLVSPYLIRIAEREKIQIQEKFDKICSNISTMNNEQLDALKADIKKEEYSENVVAKCNEAIQLREYELIKNEISELCADTATMNKQQLDELKEKLCKATYNEVLTAPYYDKIAERESELISIELDEKCSQIADMNIEQLVALKNDILSKQDFLYLSRPYLEKIDEQIEEIKNIENNKILEDISGFTTDELDSFVEKINTDRTQFTDEVFELFLEAVDKRRIEIGIEKVSAMCDELDSFDIEKSKAVLDEINNVGLDENIVSPYIDNIKTHINDIYVKQLDEMINGFDEKSKDELTTIKSQIEQFNPECSIELKDQYIQKVNNQITVVVDNELKSVCGNIDSLSSKQSFDLIRKIDRMSFEPEKKNEYIDLVEAHIMKLENEECNKYLNYLIKKMAEQGITSVQFHVPTVSKVFTNKFDAICKTYVTVGRYELPLLLHESTVGNDDEGFALTTEFLYYKTKQGILNRIKIEDIAEFHAKKGLVSSYVQVVEKNGTSSDLPSGFTKSMIDTCAKILTSLVVYIHDERATARMQEVMEQNEIKEAEIISEQKTVEAEEKVPVTIGAITEPAPEVKVEETVTEETKVEETVPEVNVEEPVTEEAKVEETAPEVKVEEPVTEEAKVEETATEVKVEEPAPEVKIEKPATEVKVEEPAQTKCKIRFCEQCGAKITNPNAKFCYECGCKLQ